MGLYLLVSMAIAVKYDLTTNIDVTDGLTNGAECVIENIDYRVENSTRQSRYFARVLKFGYNYVTYVLSYFVHRIPKSVTRNCNQRTGNNKS